MNWKKETMDNFEEENDLTMDRQTSLRDENSDVSNNK